MYLILRKPYTNRIHLFVDGKKNPCKTELLQVNEQFVHVSDVV